MRPHCTALQAVFSMNSDEGADPGTTTTAVNAPVQRSALLTQEGFDPHAERGVEAAFSVANGSFGVRASLEEGSPASHPLVIVAGVYVPTQLPASQTLLAADDPSSISILIDGQPVQMPLVETLSHRRTLDIERGTVSRTWSFRDARGQGWRLESMRAASAADATAYLHRLRLAPVGDAAGAVSLGFGGELRVQRDGDDGSAGGDTVVTVGGAASTAAIQTEHRLRGRWSVRGNTIEARVTRDAPLLMESVGSVGREGIRETGASTFKARLTEHHRAWASRWEDADIGVEGDDELHDAVRFSLYHLLSSGAVNDGRTSIGARGLTGEAYHGHVFWDTDIFMLPALIFHHPAAARSCLLYRHRTLDAARARARSLGFAGALYAWESTDTGADRTPSSAILPDGSTIRILTGEQEHHISSAVPYAVVQYWHATGDDRFMLDAGAEIVFECARFWNSRVTFADHQHAIHKVIGPDEYHVAVDNNAYTNAMAAWSLRAASNLAGQLAAIDETAVRALLARLAIRPDEPADWSATAERIVRSSFLEQRVIEQFDGFFELAPVDVAAYRRSGIPLDLAVGFDAIQRLRVVKQPDVLMSAALLPGAWSEAALRTNYEYYEPITANASSLSPPIHAMLAFWLRDGERGRAYLAETMRIDMGDFRGAAGGVHLGAQGGLWQAVVFGLAGFKFGPDGIAFDPFLPPPLRALSFTLRWRGRRVRVRITADRVLSVEVEGAFTAVRVNNVRRAVERSAEFTFDPSVTFWSAEHPGGAHAP